MYRLYQRPQSSFKIKKEYKTSPFQKASKSYCNGVLIKIFNPVFKNLVD